jgi:hypothetical protein
VIFALDGKINAAKDVTIRIYNVCAEAIHRRHHLYSGGCKPGDRSQSLIWDAVSAWRARRNSNSRAVLPAGWSSAAFLKRSASSANRSSKESLCLMRRRSMTQYSSLFYTHKSKS